MEFSFKVGQTERHSVQFKYSRLVNTVWINVDGDLVKRDRFRVVIPASRHYEFQVGDSEQHNIAINTAYSGAWAKFINPTCRVFVDGNFVGEY